MSIEDFILDQQELEKQISSSLQKDLKIVHRKKTYSVISFIAAGKSRYIYNLYLSDPLINSIELNLPKGDLTPIISFLNGESFVKQSNSTIFLYEAAIVLEIEEIINILQDEIFKDLDFANSIRLFKLAFVHGIDCPSITKYISENFNQNCANEISTQLNESQIDYLFRNEYFSFDKRMLVLKNFNFINEPNHRLAKYIKEQEALVKNQDLNLNTLRYVLIERFFSIHESNE